jgi:hypothetical protein
VDRSSSGSAISIFSFARLHQWSGTKIDHAKGMLVTK